MESTPVSPLLLEVVDLQLEGSHLEAALEVETKEVKAFSKGKHNKGTVLQILTRQLFCRAKCHPQISSVSSAQAHTLLSSPDTLLASMLMLFLLFFTFFSFFPTSNFHLIKSHSLLISVQFETLCEGFLYQSENSGHNFQLLFYIST